MWVLSCTFSNPWQILKSSTFFLCLVTNFQTWFYFFLPSDLESLRIKTFLFPKAEAEGLDVNFKEITTIDRSFNINLCLCFIFIETLLYEIPHGLHYTTYPLLSSLNRWLGWSLVKKKETWWNNKWAYIVYNIRDWQRFFRWPNFSKAPETSHRPIYTIPYKILSKNHAKLV